MIEGMVPRRLFSPIGVLENGHKPTIKGTHRQKKSVNSRPLKRYGSGGLGMVGSGWGTKKKRRSHKAKLY